MYRETGRIAYRMEHKKSNQHQIILLADRLSVYIHVILKQDTVNFTNSVRKCSVNLGIFSKTQCEISCFSCELGWPLLMPLLYHHATLLISTCKTFLLL